MAFVQFYLEINRVLNQNFLQIIRTLRYKSGNKYRKLPGRFNATKDRTKDNNSNSSPTVQKLERNASFKYPPEFTEYDPSSREDGEQSFPGSRRILPTSCTQDVVTKSLTILKPVNPSPEPLKSWPSQKVSDEEKARIMYEQYQVELKYKLQRLIEMYELQYEKQMEESGHIENDNTHDNYDETNNNESNVSKQKLQDKRANNRNRFKIHTRKFSTKISSFDAKKTEEIAMLLKQLRHLYRRHIPFILPITEYLKNRITSYDFNKSDFHKAFLNITATRMYCTDKYNEIKKYLEVSKEVNEKTRQLKEKYNLTALSGAVENDKNILNTENREMCIIQTGPELVEINIPGYLDISHKHQHLKEVLKNKSSKIRQFSLNDKFNKYDETKLKLSSQRAAPINSLNKKTKIHSPTSQEFSAPVDIYNNNKKIKSKLISQTCATTEEHVKDNNEKANTENEKLKVKLEIYPSKEENAPFKLKRQFWNVYNTRLINNKM